MINNDKGVIEKDIRFHCTSDLDRKVVNCYISGDLNGVISFVNEKVESIVLDDKEVSSFLRGWVEGKVPGDSFDSVMHGLFTKLLEL